MRQRYSQDRTTRGKESNWNCKEAEKKGTTPRLMQNILNEMKIHFFRGKRVFNVCCIHSVFHQ